MADDDVPGFDNFLDEVRTGVSVGVTINTGNYSSFKLDLWEMRNVPEGDDPAAFRSAMYEELKEEIRNLTKSIRGSKGSGRGS